MSSKENHTEDTSTGVDENDSTKQKSDVKSDCDTTTQEESCLSTSATVSNGHVEPIVCTAGGSCTEDISDMELSTPRGASHEQDWAVTDGTAGPEGCTTIEEVEKEMVEMKVIYNKQTFNVVFPMDSTVLALKEHIQQLTDVEVKNQKIMYKGLMKDEFTLREHKMTHGAKVMVVGSKTTDIQSVNQTVSQSKDDKSVAASSKELLCKQKPHKTVLDKYGKPDDVMPGIKSGKEPLPQVPLSGMYNKVGSKVRLTFKLEADQVWIGTKERTEKVGLTSIKTIVSEPIEGHEEYHLLGIQLGPTEASRYWIYWVPAQYVDSIKDTVLGNWQYF